MRRFTLLMLVFSLMWSGCAFAENRGEQTLHKLDDIIEECIQPGMSDYEKALALHDWLVEHVDYSIQGIGSFHADSALLDGFGVCQSYTEAYNLLLGRAGLTCKTIMTSIHEWTVVQLDGAWYHVDVTYDDGSNSYDFFGIPDFAIKDIEYHCAAGYCCSYQNSYAYKNGFLTSFINRYKREIQSQLNSGDRKFTVSITTSIDNDGDDIMKRTAMVAVCDQKYQVDGISKKIYIDVSHDSMEGYQLLVDVDAALPDQPENPNGSDFYNLSVAYDYPVIHCLDIRADVGGGTGGYVCIIKVIRDDGTIFYDNGRGWSYLKDNDIYLPRGEYTVNIYITDGRTEINNSYEVDFSRLSYHNYLPDDTNRIESEAFSGSGIGSFMLCSDGLTRIESKAFANCKDLQLIEIPETVQFIADDAFSDCAENLIITGIPGSYVEKYCKKHGIRFNGKVNKN